MINTIFQVMAEGISGLLYPETTSSVDRRTFLAVQSLGASTVAHADAIILNRLIAKGWPLNNGGPADRQVLDNNQVFLLALEARPGIWSELSLRDSLNEYARQDRYAGIVSYMRDHVCDLEAVADELVAMAHQKQVPSP